MTNNGERVLKIQDPAEQTELPPRQKFSISPTVEMVADLERFAKEDHCSMSSIIYRAVAHYVQSRDAMMATLNKP